MKLQGSTNRQVSCLISTSTLPLLLVIPCQFAFLYCVQHQPPCSTLRPLHCASSNAQRDGCSPLMICCQGACTPRSMSMAPENCHFSSNSLFSDLCVAAFHGREPKSREIFRSQTAASQIVRSCICRRSSPADTCAACPEEFVRAISLRTVGNPCPTFKRSPPCIPRSSRAVASRHSVHVRFYPLFGMAGVHDMLCTCTYVPKPHCICCRN